MCIRDRNKRDTMRSGLLLLLCLFCATSAVQLTASPNWIEDVENITVSWSGITNPTSNDWIGLFSPTNSDDEGFIGYLSSNQSVGWQSGTGSVVFELMNMRQPYQFRYIRENITTGANITLATSNFVNVSADVPMQIHLQFTEDPMEMRVMWVQGLLPAVSIVEFREDGNTDNKTANGMSYTYTKDDIGSCYNDSYASEYFRDPGQIHDVLLSELKPNTKYYYRCGTKTKMSQEYYFWTRQFSGPDVGVNVVAFGDMGASRCEEEIGWCEPNSVGTSDNVYAQLQDGVRYDMVLHIGDISYAVGDAWRWDQFFWQIQPISSILPWMTSIGNHEYDHHNQPFKPKWSNYGDDSHGECGIPFFYRFHSPGNNLWWSMNVGNVHFVLISLEHDFTRGSEQFMWLKKDLTSVDRSSTPFIVLGGHRPMYCTGNFTDDYIMSLHIQDQLEDLFFEYQVDLAIWGHQHSYERSCPVYKQECNERGTVHVVTGMAGFRLDASWMIEPEWNVFRDDQHFGYSVITSDAGSLTLSFVDNNDRTVLDSVTLLNRFQ
eukprot:TRINITY_DN391_c0_g1_i1.p1 TRINITY_DN391_c0_g1~~TRINITY_DN391_c0_g1_i1.p1  ORF type:complete len:546 (-),score=112.39 TRINITY_DN391_c0_g1_i1:21-1658(-)